MDDDEYLGEEFSLAYILSNGEVRAVHSMDNCYFSVDYHPIFLNAEGLIRVAIEGSIQFPMIYVKKYDFPDPPVVASKTYVH
jgi:hypothetical protein